VLVEASRGRDAFRDDTDRVHLEVAVRRAAGSCTRSRLPPDDQFETDRSTCARAGDGASTSAVTRTIVHAQRPIAISFEPRTAFSFGLR
jgi:hypothetical protein